MTTPPIIRALLAIFLIACSAVILVGGCYALYLTGTYRPPKETYIYEPKPVRKY